MKFNIEQAADRLFKSGEWLCAYELYQLTLLGGKTDGIQEKIQICQKRIEVMFKENHPASNENPQSFDAVYLACLTDEIHQRLRSN